MWNIDALGIAYLHYLRSEINKTNECKWDNEKHARRRDKDEKEMHVSVLKVKNKVPEQNVG